MNAVFLSDRDTPRALITGLRGFTGPYLSQELKAAGYDVFGTVNRGEVGGDGIYEVDLCEPESIVRVVLEVQPDVVVHLAAISFVSFGDVEAIYRVNIIGTRNLLEALTKCDKPPRVVVLASSANIYGNACVELIHETIAPAPANDYAVSKLAMEYLAKLWCEYLPILVVRPFNYTGVGQSEKFLIPKIVSHFVQRKGEIELGNLDVARDFSDVRAVVSAYRRLIEFAPPGEVFNVCSEVAHSLKDILAMMAEIAGYEIAVKVNPRFVRPGEVKRLLGSDVKFRRVAGEIERIPFRDTLRWMYESALPRQ